MLKILTQGDNEKFTNEVFKNVERCPNDIERTLIKKARGGTLIWRQKLFHIILERKK